MIERSISLSVPRVPQVPAALTFIDNKQIEQALDDVSSGLISLYQAEIEAVGAVDTGYLRDTVRVRSRRKGERFVASDAEYSGVVEFGWINRAKGQASYPGRWPAGRAVVLLGPVVEQAFARQIRR